MAGHSKWANIQHRKGRQDEKRGKLWTRAIREITVAARAGGADLGANPRLRLAVEKAKAVNLPIDTIKRNIDKATGNLEGVNYEEIRYEGYGIGGAAIIVDTMRRCRRWCSPGCSMQRRGLSINGWGRRRAAAICWLIRRAAKWPSS